MTLTLLSIRSVSDWLYNYALSSAYRSAYVYDPSLALHREPDIWEIVRNDAVIASAIERASKSIVRPWRVEPFEGSTDPLDRKLAAVTQDALSHIDRFNARRRRLAEARILGRTYAAIIWRKRVISLGGLQEMEWWIPVELKDIDRRRFHWVVERDNTASGKTGIHLEMFDTNKGVWMRIPPELRGSLIEYIYGDTEDRVGYGRGLLEAIYFYHYMKTVTFEKVSQGIDRWANGVWIGAIDGLRAGSTVRTNEDLRLGMERVLETMRSNHQAVVERVDDIKILETSGTGHQISMDFLRYLDESIERLLNGSVRPAGYNVGATGARAQAAEEAEESEAFHQDDREDLDAVLTRDLIGAFLRVNRPQIVAAGLSGARRPVFTSEQIRKQDPERAVRVMLEALKVVPVVKREFYEKCELSQPLEGDEVIPPQQQQPQSGFPGMEGLLTTAQGGPERRLELPLLMDDGERVRVVTPEEGVTQ